MHAIPAALRAAATALGASAALVVAPIALGSPAWAGTEKVLVCHVPPDDPADQHTIAVDPKAAEAHFKNHPGDDPGECPLRCDDAGACDDGNACTIDDCVEGVCDNSRPVDCEDGDVCTTDACDPGGGCVWTANGAACNDLNACTSDDRCQPDGTCGGAPIGGCCLDDAACDDDNPCTVDSCDLTTHSCSNTSMDCSSGAPPCTEGVCEAGGCVYAPVASCADDGNACTEAVCNDATNTCETVGPRTETICNDAIDNDCDGSIDQADTDCPSCTEGCDLQYEENLADCDTTYNTCCTEGGAAQCGIKCNGENVICQGLAGTLHESCLADCPTSSS